MTDAHSSPNPDQAVSQLSQSLAQAAEGHRLLAQENQLPRGAARRYNPGP